MAPEKSASYAAADMTAGGLVGQMMPDLFRLAMSQAPVAMCLLGPDGRFLAINPAACALLGRSAEALTALTFQELTHPDNLDESLALMGQLTSGEIDSFHLVRRYERPDRVVVYGDLDVTGIRDDEARLVALLAVIVDVTKQHAAPQVALDMREQLREELLGVIESQLDPWVLLAAVRGPDGSIVDFVYRDANAAACIANRTARDDLIGRTLLDLLPAHQKGGLLAMYAGVVDTGEPLILDDFPFPSPLTDGDLRYFDNRVVKVGDGISFTWRDTTDRVRLRARLAREAASDPLTGLANRSGLAAAASTVFARRARRGGRIAVFYCDIDGLKRINDERGHEWGDIILRSVADRIAGVIRATDVAARIGGDEFVVIADGVTDESAAVTIATSIADAVTRPVHHKGDAVTPTLSIGVALADLDESFDDLLRRADDALYVSRQNRPDSHG